MKPVYIRSCVPVAADRLPLHGQQVARYTSNDANRYKDIELDWNEDIHWPHCFDYMLKVWNGRELYYECTC